MIASEGLGRGMLTIWDTYKLEFIYEVVSTDTLNQEFVNKSDRFESTLTNLYSHCLTEEEENSGKSYIIWLVGMKELGALLGISMQLEKDEKGIREEDHSLARDSSTNSCI